MGQEPRLNEKFDLLYTAPCRYFILTGGRGSGKSFAQKVFEMHLSYEQGHTILSTRYYMNSAHDSVIPEFNAKLELFGNSNHFEVTKTDVLNKRSKSRIMFRGIRTSSGTQTAKLKSIEGVTTFVLDEAEEENDESNFDKIDKSVRKKGIQNRVILIMNPTTKEHWVYRRFFQEMGVQEGFTGIKDNVCYIHSTYHDNRDNLNVDVLHQWDSLKQAKPKKYYHELMGGWLDRAEGVVFDNWSIDEVFPEHLPVSYGQDFGFSNDPTTLVKVAIEKDTIYVQEIYGKTQLSTNDIYELNKAETNDMALIVADSAEPRLISELRRMGNNIKECIKGQGSITAGISLLQNYHIKVIDSPNIVKELNNYAWHDKKSGVPVDAFNHRVDAIRYIVSDLERRRHAVSFIGR